MKGSNSKHTGPSARHCSDLILTNLYHLAVAPPSDEDPRLREVKDFP